MKLLKYSLIGACLIGLVGVRVIESSLFYDPLIEFYKGDFHHNPFPEINQLLYGVNLIFRYLINSVLLTAIIHFSFQNKSFTKFSSYFFLVLMFILLITFFIMINLDVESNLMKIFYVRRFIIQPLAGIILIPALYYQKISNQSKKEE
tara:strand:- start:3428 stop:3871 length:444 start_codon:yes stop_codon:yes gene_type:complete